MKTRPRLATHLHVGIAVAYMMLAAFCAVGLELLPVSVQRAATPYFWLVGPPANLIWGTKYLMPFAVGTAAVGGLAYAFLRARTTLRRSLLCVLLLFVWSLFGFISYAPSA